MCWETTLRASWKILAPVEKGKQIKQILLTLIIVLKNRAKFCSLKEVVLSESGADEAHPTKSLKLKVNGIFRSPTLTPTTPAFFNE